MSEQFTLAVTRLELQWLFRQFKSAEEKSLKYITPPAHPTTEQVTFHEENKRVALMLSDQLNNGTKQKLELMALREELAEATGLVGDDPAALDAISDKLAKLPEEEEYRITFDRPTAKLTLKMLEKDIQTFFGSVIPNTEKKPESDFPDPIHTKTYWINRAKKAKDILDAMRVKIERHL